MLPKYIEDISCGSVLTGDVELKKDETFCILDDAKNVYSVVQFPHHGAKNDHNIDYFCSLPLITCVLSYGIANKYGHPHGQVLHQLERFVLVNERQAFDYQISVF
jgi:beta-lactamase superfamily II metal-dependent hydrolase